MLRFAPSARFRRDVKRMQQRGRDMDKLKVLVDLLATEQPLPASYKAHPLKGSWKPHWDAHIEPDWLLIYLVDGEYLHLARTPLPILPLGSRTFSSSIPENKPYA